MTSTTSRHRATGWSCSRPAGGTIVVVVLALLAACGGPPSAQLEDADAPRGAADADLLEDAPIADAAIADARWVADARPDAAWDDATVASPDANGDASSPPPAIAFADVTSVAGIDMVHALLPGYDITGQAWGDYDGDGWLDLYLTSSNGPNRLYRNLGNGSFAEVVAPQLELPLVPSGGATFVDFDNDGDKDLYVLNLGPNRLFRNDGGVFVDITETAGVGDAGKGETASWGDYDNDGYVDLYVANWGCSACAPPGAPPEEGSLDRLYRNRGDGTFEDVSHLLGYGPRTGAGFTAVFIDYDNDGDLDIYLANDKGAIGPDGVPIRRNVLWRNDGPSETGWRFEEVAIAAGADLRIDSMGVAVGDLNNDGWLDLAVTDGGPLHLLRNTSGAFTATALPPPAGFPVPMGWGVVFADFDNDGRLDIYQAASLTANRVFHNQAAGFVDVSYASGGGDPGPTYGVAYADYDRDGRVDIVIGNRGDRYRLYRNVSVVAGSNGWLSVELHGAGPVNRDAIGGRVYVSRSDGLVLMREVKCGSSLGAGNELGLHFGLGGASVDAVTVVWPNGAMTALGPVATNQHLSISYPQP